MDLKAELTKKVGPLPMWGWAAIGGVGVFLLLHMKKSAATNTSNNNGTGANTANPLSFGPSGDTGGGSGGQIILTNPPPVTTPPVTTPPTATPQPVGPTTTLPPLGGGITTTGPGSPQGPGIMLPAPYGSPWGEPVSNPPGTTLLIGGRRYVNNGGGPMDVAPDVVGFSPQVSQSHLPQAGISSVASRLSGA